MKVNVLTQVSTLAVINHMVLIKAARTEDYQRCLRLVEKDCQIKLGELEPINFAHTLSLLYCLIVVPKEVWRPEKDSTVYLEMANDGVLDLFKVERATNQFDQAPVFYLVRCLRNAVAHARFSLTEDRRFRFWDQNPPADPHFFASVTLDELGRFLVMIAKKFDRLRILAEGGGATPLPRPEGRH